MSKKVAAICEEGYIYVACDKDNFPRINGVPDEWYDRQNIDSVDFSIGQLEFRIYENEKPKELKEYYAALNSFLRGFSNGVPPFPQPPACQAEWKPYPASGRWTVRPALYWETGEKFFPEFVMNDIDVLKLWLQVVQNGGVVSDGSIDLFKG